MTTSQDQGGATAPADEATEEGQAYQFDRLSLPLILADMRFRRDDPKAGDQVPQFDLATSSGDRFRSDQLGDRPVLLVFGSLTCPITEAAGPGINELHARYGDRVRFVVVNVREAHPGENIEQPHNMADKLAHADDFQKHHDFGFEVAVDDMEGSLHRALGPKPNSAYLIDPSGAILVRAQWANDTKALDEALGAVVAGQAPPRSSIGSTMPNVVRSMGYIDGVLDRAGTQAKRDMWTRATPMAAMARLASLFGRLPVAKRGAAAVATMMTTMIVAAAIVAVIII